MSLDGLFALGAIAGAFSARGKNKGRLQRACPSADGPAVVWLSLMHAVNHFKVGFGLQMRLERLRDLPSLALLQPAALCAASAIMQELRVKQGPQAARAWFFALDKDRESLERAGVW